MSELEFSLKIKLEGYLLFATFSLPPSLQSVIEGCDNILNGMGSFWMIGVAVKAFLDVL